LSGGTEDVKEKSLSTPHVEAEPSNCRIWSRSHNLSTAESETNLLFH
jgi:hypothetical protein